MVERVEVPTLNDELVDFQAMFKLREKIQAATSVVLDFSRCRFLRHTGVAFLGALIRQATLDWTKVEIDWGTVELNVLRNLRQNGFAQAFGDQSVPWEGNSVPFREDAVSDPAGILSYLSNLWLGRGWINVSERVSNLIKGRVWEIYSNAFEHAGSEIGVVTCGQHYPRNRQLSLCVVDLGRGIPRNVRAFLGNEQMQTREAFRWAFSLGNSTNPTLKQSRGMGLTVLSDFVKVNHGRLTVYSGGGYALMSQGPAIFGNTGIDFPGTIVDIRFVCDESRYVLSSEVQDAPLF